MTALLPFVLAFFVGYLVSMRLIDLDDKIDQLLLRIFIGIGIGIGLLSAFTFISFFLPFSPNNFFISKAVNKILLVICTLLCLAVLFYEIKGGKIKFNFKSLSLMELLISFCVFISLIFIFDRFWAISAENSHGGWDAWSIWNLHARFIFLAGGDWRNLFAPQLVWSHVDYPLLTPAMIVFGWKILGNDSRLVPMLLGGIFMFSNLGIIFSALKVIRNYQIATMGLLFLGFTLLFIKESAFQYADVPLAFYLSAIIALTMISTKSKQQSNKVFVLIGGLIGFAAWTKNEGIFFGAIYIVLFAIQSFFYKKQSWKKLGAMFLGLLPMTIMLSFYKTLTLGNDIMSNVVSGGNLIKIVSLERYQLVFSNAFKVLVNFGQLKVNVLILLGMLIFVLGVQRQSIYSGNVLALGVLFVTFSSYLFIYVLTPKELTWHIQTSFLRLLIQLYPAMIMVVFSFLRNPFEKRNGS